MYTCIVLNNLPAYGDQTRSLLLSKSERKPHETLTVVNGGITDSGDSGVLGRTKLF